MNPKYVMTVGEAKKILSEYPDDMPLFTNGYVRDLWRHNVESGSFKKILIAEYDCDGGHMGTYDLWQPASQPQPEFCIKKNLEFEALVFYPSPFDDIKRMKKEVKGHK